jgi:uncharacterized protein YcfL
MKIMMPFLILLLTATGCVTHVETTETLHPETQPQTAKPQPQPQPQPQAEGQTVVDKRVVIDPALAHVIRIVGVKSTAGSEGFLKIQVNVQSLINSSKQFNYRIEWFDRDGLDLPMAASASTPWMLLSHETSLLAATAPTPAAKDFRVTFLGPGN